MIKVQDIAYVAFRVPDLDRMEAFLTDFGMARAERSGGRLFMRGAGKYPYINAVEKGDAAGFVACGLVAGSAADLDRLAKLPGASPVEAIDAPGGGRRVRLQTPDGFGIHVVHGVATQPEMPLRDPLVINYARDKNRFGALQRPAHEPARILRLGHCVLKVSDAERTVAWLHETLGLIVSDRLHAPDDPKKTIGIFLRCDRGAGWADHHTMFILHDPAAVKLHHTSYEVQDPDAVFIGHYWLKEKGWKHEWGVGRHILGSQVFDYWRDPWGHMFEHYADGDLLTATTKPGNHPAVHEMLYQWGPNVPETFLA
jgi:catechol 2,3-dioxygenase-like lactoylglutathione lyase family enzyme